MPNTYPKLGSWDSKTFTSAVKFFNYGNKASEILGLGGGTGDLRYFFIEFRYKKDIESFKHRPLKHPVIVLIDNDQGASNIFSTVKESYNIDIDLKASKPFFHVTDNLYLVKTPETGAIGESCIEDFFDPLLLRTKLNGKKFNPNKDQSAEDEYGKFIFAESVVRPKAATIDFTGFTTLLDRIVAVINDYSPPAAAAG